MLRSKVQGIIFSHRDVSLAEAFFLFDPSLKLIKTDGPVVFVNSKPPWKRKLILKKIDVKKLTTAVRINVNTAVNVMLQTDLATVAMNTVVNSVKLIFARPSRARTKPSATYQMDTQFANVRADLLASNAKPSIDVARTNAQMVALVNQMTDHVRAGLILQVNSVK